MADAEGIAAVAHGLATGGSDLLAAMPPDDLAFIAGRSRRGSFAMGEAIGRTGVSADEACFIESGVVSVVKVEASGRKTEICLIGPEGLSGATPLLAGRPYPYDVYAQSDQLRVVILPGADLKLLVERSPAARGIITAAIYGQIIQVAENLVSAAWQQVGPRLARWLLMYRERLRSDRMEVTHAFMAIMIGAQRTKVTSALHELEATGAIVASRGLVVVKDAEKLRALAGERWSTLQE